MRALVKVVVNPVDGKTCVSTSSDESVR